MHFQTKNTLKNNNNQTPEKPNPLDHKLLTSYGVCSHSYRLICFKTKRRSITKLQGPKRTKKRTLEPVIRKEIVILVFEELTSRWKEYSWSHKDDKEWFPNLIRRINTSTEKSRLLDYIVCLFLGIFYTVIYNSFLLPYSNHWLGFVLLAKLLWRCIATTASPHLGQRKDVAAAHRVLRQ